MTVSPGLCGAMTVSLCRERFLNTPGNLLDVTSCPIGCLPKNLCFYSSWCWKASVKNSPSDILGIGSCDRLLYKCLVPVCRWRWTGEGHHEKGLLGSLFLLCGEGCRNRPVVSLFVSSALLGCMMYTRQCGCRIRVFVTGSLRSVWIGTWMCLVPGDGLPSYYSFILKGVGVRNWYTSPSI